MVAGSEGMPMRGVTFQEPPIGKNARFVCSETPSSPAGRTGLAALAGAVMKPGTAGATRSSGTGSTTGVGTARPPAKKTSSGAAGATAAAGAQRKVSQAPSKVAATATKV